MKVNISISKNFLDSIMHEVMLEKKKNLAHELLAVMLLRAREATVDKSSDADGEAIVDIDFNNLLAEDLCEVKIPLLQALTIIISMYDTVLDKNKDTPTLGELLK